MSNPIITDNITQLFDLLVAHKVFYLVGKERINSLSEALRGYTSYATEELLNEIGTPLRKVRDEIFVFTNENYLYRGMRVLKSRENLENYEVLGITSPPGLLVKKIVQLNPEVLHIDYHAESALDIPQDSLPVLERLLILASLAKIDGVFVLQDSKGYGLEMSFEDEKKYAMAFVNEEDSADTIAALSEDKPGSKVSLNELRQLSENLSRSHLDGLILNPGTKVQDTFSREELGWLYTAVLSAKGEGFSISGLVKDLLGKKK